MFNALAQTNQEQKETFYDIAFDMLTQQAGEGQTASMLELLSQAKALVSNLSSTSSSVFILNRAVQNNYAKNLKLYLENKAGSTQKQSLTHILKTQALLASNSVHTLEEKFIVRSDYPSNQFNEFIILEQQNLQTNNVLDKNHNLWMNLNADYASTFEGALYGGGLSGGYDYIFPNTPIFASLGFSLNYSYSQYQQLQLTTQSNAFLAGVHSDFIVDNHEVMMNVLAGSAFNTLSTAYSHLATSFQGGFKLRDYKSQTQDILLNTQIFYKYIFNLGSFAGIQEGYQELKPVVGLEYSYFNLGKSQIDIFKVQKSDISLPTLKAGIEYGFANEKQVHLFSLLVGYSFLDQKGREREVFVGTASYKEHPYVQSKILEANIMGIYTGSIHIKENIRVDYLIKGESSLLELGYFEVGGNVGVNWRF